MIISNQFNESNYHKKIYKKTKIVIGNTLTSKMSHIDLWKHKLNGTFKGIPPFVTKNYKKNELLTWCGNIYNKEDGPVPEVKWRGKMRWPEYTQNQMDSLFKLTEDLIDEFNIDRYVSEHNTKIMNISEKRGIYYRSNYNINYLDVSPVFNFKEFKQKIENNGTIE